MTTSPKHGDDRQYILELYAECAAAMYIAALRIVHDPHTAEDIVQEAFSALICRPEAIRAVAPEKRKAYAVSASRNLALNYAVKRDRRSRYAFLTDGTDIPEPADPRDTIDDRLIAEAEIGQLRHALALLDERDRNILEWKYYRELADADIAVLLHVETASIRSALTRARRRLRDILLKEENTLEQHGIH